MLTHVSLFSGIGGIDLAAEWAGFETVLFVEIDKYCQKVLNKHWPNVPIIEDIKYVTRKTITDTQGNGLQKWRLAQQRQTGQFTRNSEISDRERKGTIAPITLVTGGFPCQPVSGAGKRKGKDDDRWLWPEMFRVISEIRPTWVVPENVAGLLNMGIDGVLSDLESIGYETTPFLIPACGVNAPHQRNRVFIVGYSKCNGHKNGYQDTEGKIGQSEQGGVCQFKRTGNVANTANKRPIQPSFQREPPTTIKRTSILADPLNEGLPKRKESEQPQSILSTKHGSLENGDNKTLTDTGGQRGRSGNGERENAENVRELPRGTKIGNWDVEPDVGRVAYGVSSRVDRLKALGNAVVPQQIYPILKAIADIERGVLSTL